MGQNSTQQQSCMSAVSPQTTEAPETGTCVKVPTSPFLGLQEDQTLSHLPPFCSDQQPLY